jgi:hypothetical protein
MFGSQLVVCFRAFTWSPIKGILCLLVPFYVFVYAETHLVGARFMRTWFAGLAMWLGGAVIAA